MGGGGKGLEEEPQAWGLPSNSCIWADGLHTHLATCVGESEEGPHQARNCNHRFILAPEGGKGKKPGPLGTQLRPLAP